ncbi:bifunctional [glutamine synthetase] adenylyltransferase/[glutamine synthetase]-adenylyl-L-tyrosine phosphorylase [Ornithinicoccus halotolerans]|uniref:bifunctional [glutamine synthetase] adenylyltransferase/[glutamine synthetase]-adenylyl-L-tyrosine phosphorylase n=1 Tax=Ornithinicoccus halotolerans TaxID=1748220 RepID=UPI0012965F43|nr:bifunctional [glutamine synthetase] adenylyltransferase/[glutamine synthetase]-adenylyl-L-tyrosine phosphorylase [Ornithinicoccus halotolerans]
MTRPAGTAELLRSGFTDGERAGRLLEELVERCGAGHLEDRRRLLEEFAGVADPDQALLGVVRLVEADGELVDMVATPGPARQRLLAVLGASSALTDHLVHHPEQVHAVSERAPVDPAAIPRSVAPVVAAAEAPERAGEEDLERRGMDALRVAYREQLVRVVADDLTSEDPLAAMPPVAAVLADLAGAALQAATDLARALVPGSGGVRFAVVGLGKCGGQELNYVSDVDVIFLAEPDAGTSDDEAVRVGERLASTVMRVCHASTSEGTLWPVDAALRPEGKQGPLVRTLASHREYYRRWARTWEFQALLKARPVAGDLELAQEWCGMVRPLVWGAGSQPGFVEEVQGMRRRVEEQVPSAESDRQLKLGPGGLRDIEFSVQLLQLVHGRADETLRSGTTLEALAALRDGGYVGREDAAALDTSYRYLRVLEHRVQLHRMRRTHLMPADEASLRRLGRAVGERGEAAAAVLQRWRSHQREVRRLHERLFYRPLLVAVAQLSTDEVRLTPEAARERLAALGFRDPAGAMRHLEALTSGVSRRATIQRHLLPVMLGWFAGGADPDAGLLAFRRISETLGSTHWYLRMLRDEGTAAQRLAHVLSTSRYVVDLLIRSPETVALLGDQAGLQPPGAEVLAARMAAASRRHQEADAAFLAVRTVRARELLRVVLADLVGDLDQAGVRSALTALTDCLLQAALEVATRVVLDRRGEEQAVDLLVVGMGRLGGAELGYVSDADVMYVYRPRDWDEQTAQRAAAQAEDIIAELRRGLSKPGPDPTLELDAGLRPEGRSGPLVRSLESYQAYYARWSAGWESQALLRARPVAGDERLAAEYESLIDPLRWPEGGLEARTVREIRRLKARMEGERLPRGADRRTHFKLGYGGLSDVEWVVQLLQLEHGHEVAALRTTSTLVAMQAAVEAGLLSSDDAAALRRAWSLGSRLRDAGVLWRGRPVDSVPSDARDAEGISRIIGRGPGQGGELADEWRRTARRCRQVVERVFYGEEPGSGAGGP